MKNFIRLILVIILLLSFGNLSLAENKFYDEGKKNILKKSTKNQNFYFKEV